MTVRAIEFIGGGPLDGEARLVDNEMETAVVLDGLVVHIYQREEVFNGPTRRDIMRWIREVPIGNRRLPTD